MLDFVFDLVGADVEPSGQHVFLREQVGVPALRHFFKLDVNGDFGLGLDAMWQLVGFWLGWSGSPGKGRALGVGEVKFTGQVTPDVKKVVYKIDLKRVINRRLVMGIADGVLEADGVPIYTASDMRVGLFGATEPVGG